MLISGCSSSSLLRKGFCSLNMGLAATSYQHHHYLPRGKAPLYQHMAQPSPALQLVIDLYLKFRQHFPYAEDYPVRRFVLYHTFVHRDDGVAAGLIYAGHDPPAPVQPEGGVDLVAVVQGLVHAYYVFHMAEAAQNTHGLSLLIAELLLIGEVLQLAAAALAVVGAGGLISFPHIKHPFPWFL